MKQKPIIMKTYRELVLNTNKTLKEESAKLGYCIKVLKGFDQLPKEFKPILAKIDKDTETYNKCIDNVRVSKSGKFTAFYLLQYLYKEYKSEAV